MTSPPNPSHEARKADHIRIVLHEDVEPPGPGTGLAAWRLEHQALPELDLDEVEPATTLLGRPLRMPVLISCMTGGVAEGGVLNRRLARAAQRAGVALGVGSQRAALDDPALAETFRVRDLAPDVPVLANLGAAQLRDRGAAARCRRAVAMCGADALVIHANPLQEALQPEGTPGFAGMVERIGDVAAALEVPVIVKEVGHGLSAGVARALADAGVTGLDTAGAGGTSWSEVERHRIADPVLRQAALAFRDWGIPTAESLLACRDALPGGLVIASGGVRTGVDVALCLALGADAAGIAAPLMRAAAAGDDPLDHALRVVHAELRIAMFCAGARTPADLRGAARWSGAAPVPPPVPTPGR
jgi:isopentenyl-diphosphate delta-isomerase